MIKLSAEDKSKFREEIKKANPIEILKVKAFIDTYKTKFDKEDIKFMISCIGKRCDKLLKNVVNNINFND